MPNASDCFRTRKARNHSGNSYRTEFSSEDFDSSRLEVELLDGWSRSKKPSAVRWTAGPISSTTARPHADYRTPKGQGAPVPDDFLNSGMSAINEPTASAERLCAIASMRDSLPHAGAAGRARSPSRPRAGTEQHVRCRRIRSTDPGIGHSLDRPAKPGVLPKSRHRLGDDSCGAACRGRGDAYSWHPGAAVSDAPPQVASHSRTSSALACRPVSRYSSQAFRA